jgi:uncharacterized membrane protein (UPF0127 family)
VTSRLAGPLAAALILSACGAAPGPDRTPTPTSESGPRAVLPSGAVYSLELALTPEDQAQGLMYRESLPEKTGMLFLFPDNAPHGFWMKNTMIPLDMIWMDESGRVVYVSANTPPCKADPCPVYGPEGPARMVLEIAGGMAARENVTVGSTLKLEGLPK